MYMYIYLIWSGRERRSWMEDEMGKASVVFKEKEKRKKRGREREREKKKKKKKPAILVTTLIYCSIPIFFL